MIKYKRFFQSLHVHVLYICICCRSDGGHPVRVDERSESLSLL